MNTNELYHFGVKGMKWGVRRKRNLVSKTRKRVARKELTPEQRSARRKKALKIGAAVVGTALAVYGAKKFHDVVRDKNLKLHIENGKKYYDQYAKRMGDSYNELERLYKSQGFSLSQQDHLKRSRDFIDRSISSAAKSSISGAYKQASRDSFATAVKNVAVSEIERRRKR